MRSHGGHLNEMGPGLWPFQCAIHNRMDAPRFVKKKREIRRIFGVFGAENATNFNFFSFRPRYLILFWSFRRQKAKLQGWVMFLIEEHGQPFNTVDLGFVRFCIVEHAYIHLAGALRDNIKRDGDILSLLQRSQSATMTGRQ